MSKYYQRMIMIETGGVHMLVTITDKAPNTVLQVYGTLYAVPTVDILIGETVTATPVDGGDSITVRRV